eukprot:scaffold44592_cov65-Phaeocystis_antarctica.AAC.1
MAHPLWCTHLVGNNQERLSKGLVLCYVARPMGKHGARWVVARTLPAGMRSRVHDTASTTEAGVAFFPTSSPHASSRAPTRACCGHPGSKGSRCTDYSSERAVTD